MHSHLIYFIASIAGKDAKTKELIYTICKKLSSQMECTVAGKSKR